MLRYKGVLDMQGTNRKVIFQGVHQLMGSDLGPRLGCRAKSAKASMVFIGIDLPQDILAPRPGSALGIRRVRPEKHCANQG